MYLSSHCTLFKPSIFIVIIICVGLSACTGRQLSEDVSVTSFMSHNGDTINAHLYLPANKQAPYPIVIDLHGCNGIWAERTEQWVPRLNNDGFAVLQIDSFGSRGADNICSDVFKVAPIIRVMDIASVMPLISADPRLDKDNIFLLGMSHGGTTTLLTNMHASPIFSQLKGAIAYYPYCPGILPVLNTDLLVMIGALDDWTPADLCQEMHILSRNGHSFDLIVYSGAYHSFDIRGVDEAYFGHRVLYDPKAANDSFRRVRQFLKQRKDGI